MQLGKFGVWTSNRSIGKDNIAEAAKLVEELGFGTFWLGGSEQLPALRPILEATDHLVAATGILNVWASEPAQVAADYAELAGDFPDRVLLGVGVGHPEATSQYTKPLTAMREFLDGLDGASAPVPRDGRILAALGPKMLELGAERSLGAHPYFVPAAHVRFARERLGANAVLAPELACVVDGDDESAAARARKYAELYLGLRNYTNNLLRFDFTEQDIADGGSDRLIDAVVPYGSAEKIAGVVQSFVDAGADHVCVQAAGTGGIPRSEWTALASALGLGSRT
ncbi:MAG: LLM class F420-dependent oxidoreductase [Solirubrobacteraceae bacterium]